MTIRDAVAAALEVLGVLAVVVAAWLWCIPAGIAATGAAVAVLGRLVEP